MTTGGAPDAQKKEEVAMRKIFFFSCGLLFLLGSFSCAQLGVAPTPLEPINLSGTEDFTSEPFDVNTREWQINWQYKAAVKRGYNFVLTVYPEGDEANYTEMVVSPPLPEGSGSTYLYKGKGRYYIKVRAKKIADWQIGVTRAGVSEPLTSPATFAGIADTSTKPFKITGSEFKINYEMEPKGGWAGQTIAVYPRGETTSHVVMSTIGPGAGSEVVKGPGEYYMKVQCTGVKSWKIDVTE
jgi:hypothetical protein